MGDAATILFQWTVFCTLEPRSRSRRIMLFFETFIFNSWPYAGDLPSRDSTHSFNESVGGVFNSYVHS